MILRVYLDRGLPRETQRGNRKDQRNGISTEVRWEQPCSRICCQARPRECESLAHSRKTRGKDSRRCATHHSIRIVPCREAITLSMMEGQQMRQCGFVGLVMIADSFARSFTTSSVMRCQERPRGLDRGESTRRAGWTGG